MPEKYIDWQRWFLENCNLLRDAVNAAEDETGLNWDDAREFITRIEEGSVYDRR